jgi:hypothetical protein
MEDEQSYGSFRAVRIIIRDMRTSVQDWLFAADRAKGGRPGLEDNSKIDELLAHGIKMRVLE